MTDRTPPVETPEDAPADPAREHAEAGGQGPDPTEAAAAEGALDATDEIAGARAELDGHRERVRELEDQLLRRAAEFQNYRRRTQEDLAGAAARGRAEAVARLLDVYDDLGRSLEAAEQAAEGERGGPRYEALKQGLDLVHRKFADALAALGVEPIEAVGQPFDEALHEALLQQDAEDRPSGTVVSEIQKGYRMGDRVLRHARVAVAR